MTTLEQTFAEQPPAAKLDIHSAISYPKRGNNAIRTFMEGADFYSALYERCQAAQSSIWCAVSFGSWSFQFPNGEKWWQVFVKLKQQNPTLIIRVLFWRNTDRRWQSNGVIMGTQKDADLIQLHSLQSCIQFKWDESPEAAHCHHGKYFVIDAEKDENVANVFSFVGGMTLNDIVYSQSRHDTVIELNGPCSMDVMHSFKLRWNHHNIFHHCAAMQVCQPFVTAIADQKKQQPLKEQKQDEEEEEESTECKQQTKGVEAQICVTLYPKLYPGYEAGESSIHSQYYRAFYHATRCIYLESQHPGDLHLLQLMKWKLRNVKDFKIVFIVPINMMHPIVKAKRESLQYIRQCQEVMKGRQGGKHRAMPKEPRYHEMFSTLASLKQYENFSLCGLYKSAPMDDGSVWYEDMYVHSKLCIVDGAWFTIGSANFVDISFIHDHSEVNVAVFDEAESLKLMRTLAAKHCQQTVQYFDEMTDVQMVSYMQEQAQQNTKHKASKRVLHGRLYALDPETYAS